MKHLIVGALIALVTLFAIPNTTDAAPGKPVAQAEAPEVTPEKPAPAITSGWTILQGEVVEVTPGPVYSVTIETANGNRFTFRLNEYLYNWFSTRIGKTVKVHDRHANNDPGPPPVAWLIVQPFIEGDWVEEVE